MTESLIIICTSFFGVLVAYWIMPIKKMKEVNKALIALVQNLPISKIINAIRDNGKS
jgi:hypothetical protein